jgi:TolB-like protein
MIFFLDMQIFKFGNFYLNTQSRQVLKNGKPVVLTPKTFDVLQFLVENHGKIVSKDELLEKVWNGQIVEESNLAVQISKLRNLLTSDKTEPLIETVPGSGYRFVAIVQPTDLEEWKENAEPKDYLSKKTFSEQNYSDSIAVLPLQNEIADEEIDYLADGITESIISSLAYIPNLKIIARNSVFRYKNKDVDIKEVSESLGVSKVLTGRVRIIRDNLFISVELINAPDNSQIWGFQFNQPFSDIIKIQQEIISAVSEKLRVEVSQVINNSVKNSITENTESYRLYLKGKHFLSKLTEQSIYKAIDCFESSITYDPLNVYSYVEIVECFRFLYISDCILYDAALAKINSILSIISDLNKSGAEVQTIFGSIKETFEWKFEEAENCYKNALLLNPNYLPARVRYSLLLVNKERFSEALEQINKIISLDPISTINHIWVGRLFYRMEQYKNAINYLKESLDLESRSFVLFVLLSAVYAELGEYDLSLDYLNKSLEIEFNLDTYTFTGYVYGLSGRKAEARKIIEQLKSKYQNTHHISHKLAVIYAGLKEKETACYYLEKSFEEHTYDLSAMKSDPRLKILRDEPKFKEIAARVGLSTD